MGGKCPIGMQSSRNEPAFFSKIGKTSGKRCGRRCGYCCLEQRCSPRCVPVNNGNRTEWSPIRSVIIAQSAVRLQLSDYMQVSNY